MVVSQPDLRKIRLNPNYWYPLAQSKKLKKGKAHSVFFGGEPIVLVRTESNTVFALEDRCAHRQMPLSMGVVCGQQIKCGYHAWQYNETGNVTEIPYLPEGASPPKCDVRNYPCKEAYDHIWVFPGEAELAETTAFPELSICDNPEYKTLYFFRKVNCHYSFHYENLMDMNHQFLHRRLMGNIRPTFLKSSQDSDWVEAQYKFQRGKSHFGAKFLMSGKDKTAKAANSDVMIIRTEYPYQTLQLCGANSDIPTFKTWVTYVPVDREQKAHHVVGMLTMRKPKILGLINLLLPFIRYFAEAVFDEDQMALETEQKAYNLQGADWNREVFPPILNLRQLLRSKGISLD